MAMNTGKEILDIIADAIDTEIDRMGMLIMDSSPNQEDYKRLIERRVSFINISNEIRARAIKLGLTEVASALVTRN